MARREKVWSTAWHRACVPSLPYPIRKRLAALRYATPSWLRRDFVRRWGYTEHQAQIHTAARGCETRFQGGIGSQLAGLGDNLLHWRMLDGIRIRHPLLDRELVEFSLGIPADLRAHVHHPKPVLKKAMEGIVPPRVLRRHSKGFSILPRVRWSLNRYRRTVESLIRSSRLADLGIIEPKGFAAAVDAASQGSSNDCGAAVYNTLSLETWLAVRNGDLDCFDVAKEAV